MTVADNSAIEDVLDMLLDEFGSPSPQAVAVFSRRHPEYRAELLEFAAAWAEQHYLPPPGPLPIEGQARIEARAQLALELALAGAGPARSTSPGALAELVAASGQDLDDVARQAGLDGSLIRKLDSRRIKAWTVPERLAGRLADILRVDVSKVLQSWTAPVSIAAPNLAAFMAIKLPGGPQEDFATAVASADLTPEEKAELLADE